MLKYLLLAGTDAITRKVDPWHANYVSNGWGQLAEKRRDLDAAFQFHHLRTQGAAETWGKHGILTLHTLENITRLRRILGRGEEATVPEKRTCRMDDSGDAGLYQPKQFSDDVALVCGVPVRARERQQA